MNEPDPGLLAADLKRRNARLQTYRTTRGHWWPTKASEWVAEVWQYDQVLVAVAQLLGIEVPPPPLPDAQRRLSPAERATLEQNLKHAGLDVADHETSEG